MDNPITSVSVGTLPDDNDGVFDDGTLWLDLGDLDEPEPFAVNAVQGIADQGDARDSAANYGSKTRCGKIVRRFNHRTGEPPERYLKRIYRLLCQECAPAQKLVRFLGGGRLAPTRNGLSVAYEFEVGTWDGEFRLEFTLSIPVLRRCV
ncbi:MAG: hypothetical protein FWD58_01785 [Firmicutes bacterium]|nr:hypothetical protein [Bacillota bacterium]